MGFGFSVGDVFSVTRLVVETLSRVAETLSRVDELVVVLSVLGCGQFSYIRKVRTWFSLCKRSTANFEFRLSILKSNPFEYLTTATPN